MPEFSRILALEAPTSLVESLSSHRTMILRRVFYDESMLPTAVGSQLEGSDAC
jgi:hypothetical protein